MTPKDKPDPLDEILENYAYEVYITNDLPPEKQDNEQFRLHDIYKAKINSLYISREEVERALEDDNPRNNKLYKAERNQLRAEIRRKLGIGK